MILGWYVLFPLAVMFLWIVSTERDRMAARIVLIATLAGSLIVPTLSHQVTGAWKLVVPAMGETLTILCLLRWAPNRTGYAQAACLSVAWIAHFLCYVDIRCNTDVVYSRYETILAVVAIAQIAAFYDTIGHCLRGLVERFASFQSRNFSGVRSASGCNRVLRNPDIPKL